MTIRSRQIGALFSLLLLCLGFYLLYVYLSQSEPAPLNMLAYIGYDENEITSAFANETGIRVRVKPYFGGDEMYSLLSQSRGKYDLVVVEPEYLSRLVDKKLLQPLDAREFDLADYFERFRSFDEFSIQGNVYAIPIRFGVNGMVFNTTKVSREAVSTYEVIWSDRYNKRIGLIDQYLISMGAVSKAAGHENAYDLDNDQFRQLVADMNKLKGRLASVYSVPDMYKALANEEIWILPCGGESVVYNLRQYGKFDWVIPNEGGIMWVEGLGIVNGARRAREAQKYIKWAITAEAQALLATRKAYASNVPNHRAYEHLRDDVRQILRSESEVKTDSLLRKLSLRTLPSHQSPSEWLSAWQAFKAR